MEDGGRETSRADELILRARLERDPARKLYYATRAIELSPDNTKAWIERGKALLKSGMLSEAEEQIGEVIRQDPDDGEGWYLHGLLMSMTGKLDHAQDSLEKAAATLKEPSSAQYALGILLAKRGEYDEALHLFDAALREQKKNPEIWYARGKLLVAMKRYHQAVISFDHAAEVRPEDEVIREERRKTIRLMNRDLEAAEDRDFALLRGDADFEGLVRLLIREKDARAFKAAEQLVTLGTGATPHIRPLLAHADPMIRIRGLQVLLAIRDPRCAGLFVRLALSLPTPGEGGGKKASQLLKQIGDALSCMNVSAPVEGLRNALESGDEKKIIRAISLLERTRGEGAVDQLLLATDHPSPRVVFAALSTLGAIGDIEAVDRVFTIQNRRDPAIRSHAKGALRHIVRRSLPEIVRRYAYGNDGERAFIYEIVRLVGTGLGPNLQKILSSADEPVIRDAASDILVAAADATGIPVLINALTSPDENVRKNAAAALTAIGVPAIQPLIYTLGDSRRRVRDRVKEILAGMGRPAVPALLGAIESGETGIGEAAEEILLLMGQAAVPALEDTLSTNTNSEWKTKITSLIRQIQKKERTKRLLAEYRGEEPI